MENDPSGNHSGHGCLHAAREAKGKAVDRRADIWAFGCVLYEMLAGRRAFAGETISDVLAAVIRGEPDWTALPATTPVSIRRLVRRCLNKDPRYRLRDIGDARVALEDVLNGEADADAGLKAAPTEPAVAEPPFLRWLGLLAVAMVLAALAGTGG